MNGVSHAAVCDRRRHPDRPGVFAGRPLTPSNAANFGMGTPVAAFFKTIGGVAFNFMLPILAGYIAMSIADRPGLVAGFVGGSMAQWAPAFATIAGTADPWPQAFGRAAGRLCGRLLYAGAGKAVRQAAQEPGGHQAHFDLPGGGRAVHGAVHVHCGPHGGPA